MTDFRPVDWKVTFVLKPLPPIERAKVDRLKKIVSERMRGEIEIKMASLYKYYYSSSPEVYIPILEKIMMGYY